MVPAIIEKAFPYLLATAGLFALGYSGVLVRKGVNRGQRGLIWAPIAVWAVLYAVEFQFVTPRLFLLSLAALIVPCMGYFGLFFVPDILGVFSDD